LKRKIVLSLLSHSGLVAIGSNAISIVVDKNKNKTPLQGMGA